MDIEEIFNIILTTPDSQDIILDHSILEDIEEGD
jgi:hypothetical protein